MQSRSGLDRYFQTQVTQDVRRRIVNCFVVIEVSTAKVAAYYTISAAGIPLTDLPPEEIERLPRFPTVPAIRIGQLAVDTSHQRRGLGAALLADAAARSMKSDGAAFKLLVDAKNDQAVAFYRRLGFRLFAGNPSALFLPLATARKALFPPGLD